MLKGSVYYTYLSNAMVRRDYTLNGERTIEYMESLAMFRPYRMPRMPLFMELNLDLMPP